MLKVLKILFEPISSAGPKLIIVVQLLQLDGYSRNLWQLALNEGFIIGCGLRVGLYLLAVFSNDALRRVWRHFG